MNQTQTGSATQFEESRLHIRQRANQLVEEGSDRLQASYQALEEAWMSEMLRRTRIEKEVDELRAVLRRLCDDIHSAAQSSQSSFRHEVMVSVRNASGAYR